MKKLFYSVLFLSLLVPAYSKSFDYLEPLVNKPIPYSEWKDTLSDEQKVNYVRVQAQNLYDVVSHRGKQLSKKDQDDLHQSAVIIDRILANIRK